MLREPFGPDATRQFIIQGLNGKALAKVCDNCGKMLHTLGWVEITQWRKEVIII